MPAVSSRSLPPQGMPCSGPRYLPAAISRSACLACASARSRVRVMTQRSLGSKRCEAVEVDVGEALGGELAGLDPARELRDGGEGDVVVVGGQRAGRRACVRTKRSRAGRGGLPGQHGIPPRGGRERRVQRDFARAGAALVERGHRLAPVAGGRSALGGRQCDTARAFRLRRRWRRRPPGRRAARCRRRAARRAAADLPR